jgi:hypothetical protein
MLVIVFVIVDFVIEVNVVALSDVTVTEVVLLVAVVDVPDAVVCVVSFFVSVFVVSADFVVRVLLVAV